MDAKEKAGNKGLLAAQRLRYLNHELSHDEYYLWLSGWIGLADGLIPATDEKVRASTDPHLNDIPLRAWDAVHGIVRGRANAKGIPWSQSDTVCCLKAMARRRAGKKLT
jgi:hypothetical protein